LSASNLSIKHQSSSSNHQQPSNRYFFSFCKATKYMQPMVEEKLQGLVQVQPVSFMVLDGFLWWTLESATKFGFLSLVFIGINQIVSSMTKAIFEDKLLVGVESDDELITVTKFPWIKVTRNDFNILMPNPTNSSQEFVIDQMKKSTSNSFGYIVNSFHELKKVYVDSWNSEAAPKVWYVEPLCIAEPERKP
ncbi:hypothetical protein Goshw_006023, partial [Gossypium schwendimanii]|nr:hypothetical protein [Gossypium schwendimanii]